MANEVAVIRDYDIRDKKLVDATAQTTIESTDAIEMKTTDGNQVFIDKASFIKAVGQAFTASDPKTFTKLLGMNGDGPMGIGASDLASVLGVVTNIRTGMLGPGQSVTINGGVVQLFISCSTSGSGYNDVLYAVKTRNNSLIKVFEKVESGAINITPSFFSVTINNNTSTNAPLCYTCVSWSM